ncbi:MarR family transcriptional regulator [Rugamonas sp.]|uniref:MarR family transcriptional regulator n=1 Tax=Rugamonas sp. TaxID=1926287 RepID=UPI0025D6DA21|nr:MarR family transcriptional regulator [Rugamonas sp.]
MKLTQREIADHLDLAQQNVSVFLRQLDFDWRSATLDQIRIAYIRKLRATDTVHGRGDDDLVRERILSERVDRELKVFNLEEKKAALINVAQLEPELVAMVAAWRSFLGLSDVQLKAKLDAEYGANVDRAIISDLTNSALAHLGKYDTGHGEVVRVD